MLRLFGKTLENAVFNVTKRGVRSASDGLVLNSKINKSQLVKMQPQRLVAEIAQHEGLSVKPNEIERAFRIFKNINKEPETLKELSDVIKDQRIRDHRRRRLEQNLEEADKRYKQFGW